MPNQPQPRIDSTARSLTDISDDGQVEVDGIVYEAITTGPQICADEKIRVTGWILDNKNNVIVLVRRFGDATRATRDATRSSTMSQSPTIERIAWMFDEDDWNGPNGLGKWILLDPRFALLERLDEYSRQLVAESLDVDTQEKRTLFFSIGECISDSLAMAVLMCFDFLDWTGPLCDWIKPELGDDYDRWCFELLCRRRLQSSSSDEERSILNQVVVSPNDSGAALAYADLISNSEPELAGEIKRMHAST